MRRRGIAKGYVLFWAPTLVGSQLLGNVFVKTCKLCSIRRGGGGGGLVQTLEVHEHNKSTNEAKREISDRHCVLFLIIEVGKTL
jgi:hypothetical protein